MLTAWWSRFWWISIFPFLLLGLLGVLIQPRVAFGQFDEQVVEIPQLAVGGQGLFVEHVQGGAGQALFA